MTNEVVERHVDDSPPLDRCHALGGFTKRATASRFDLHKHDGWTITRDDVQFAAPPPVAAGKNCVPAAFELAARKIFTYFAKCDAGPTHRRVA